MATNLTPALQKSECTTIKNNTTTLTFNLSHRSRELKPPSQHDIISISIIVTATLLTIIPMWAIFVHDVDDHDACDTTSLSFSWNNEIQKGNIILSAWKHVHRQALCFMWRVYPSAMASSLTWFGGICLAYISVHYLGLISE